MDPLIRSRLLSMYSTCLASASSGPGLKKEVRALRTVLGIISRSILQTHGRGVEDLTPDERQAYSELRIISLLSSASLDEQLSQFEGITKELAAILSCDTDAAQQVGSHLTGFL